MITNETLKLLDELHGLNTSEDRLTWLSERSPIHPPFPLDHATPARRVPGCMTGLWLESIKQDDALFFMAYSDSRIVGGVASFLCDLYSGLSSAAIIDIGERYRREIKLEGLLTATRRNAIQKVMDFILKSAENERVLQKS